MNLFTKCYQAQNKQIITTLNVRVQVQWMLTSWNDDQGVISCWLWVSKENNGKINRWGNSLVIIQHGAVSLFNNSAISRSVETCETSGIKYFENCETNRWITCLWLFFSLLSHGGEQIIQRLLMYILEHYVICISHKDRTILMRDKGAFKRKKVPPLQLGDKRNAARRNL